ERGRAPDAARVRLPAGRQPDRGDDQAGKLVVRRSVLRSGAGGRHALSAGTRGRTLPSRPRRGTDPAVQRRILEYLRARLPELRALARGPILLLYLRRVRASIVAMAAHVAFMTLLLEPLLRWLIPPPERPSGLLAIFSGPAP